MKYLKKFSKRKITLNGFLFAILYFSVISCSSQIQTTQNSIPALEKIEQEPTAHYKTLKSLSAVSDQQFANLDSISFPDKAQQFAIKLFSPAYLNRDEIDSLIHTLIPPANSSEQTRAELDFLLQLQKDRTPQQVDNALRMHDIVYFPIIGYKKDSDLFFEIYEIFGSQFNSKEFPKTKKLLGNIMKEMRIAEFTAKNHFLRARPRQLEPDLKPLKKMASSSFASGHTLWAYMQAYLLAALLPEKRKDFLDLAYEIGFTREVLGVHYPSDEEASRKLAHQLLEKMWDKPNFINDFHEAQLEWVNFN